LAIAFGISSSFEIIFKHRFLFDIIIPAKKKCQQGLLVLEKSHGLPIHDAPPSKNDVASIADRGIGFKIGARFIAKADTAFSCGMESVFLYRKQ